MSIGRRVAIIQIGPGGSEFPGRSGPAERVSVNICWQPARTQPQDRAGGLVPLGQGFLIEGRTISSAPFSCLAIETATELASIALLRGDVFTVREARGMQAPSRTVYGWVGELLGEANLSLRDLDCIAFGVGPGSFTGVRVAVAMAQGLGFACGLPLCPVSTLAALAAGALRDTGCEAVACCFDARLGEVYFGAYCRDACEGVRALSADALLDPALVQLPEEGQFLAVGPGWAAYPELAARFGARLVGVQAQCLPSAADVARLARPRFSSGAVVSPAGALPNYLRNRVASTA